MAQAFDRHLGVPSKDRFEEVIERLDGLRTRFMENPANINASIDMRILATPSCY